MTAKMEGLPDSETGFFAMHIHEKRDCSEAGFPNTGGHYDPHDREHPLHAGDLPPLLSCRGRAYLAVATGRFCVKDIVGRAVVIHSQPDDFRTQPTGNAGSKIACGMIPAASDTACGSKPRQRGTFRSHPTAAFSGADRMTPVWLSCLNWSQVSLAS